MAIKKNQTNSDGRERQIINAEMRNFLVERCPDAFGTGGDTCPNCRGHVEVYDRPLTRTMARGLIRFYDAYGLQWGKLNDVLPRTNEQSDVHKFKHWSHLLPYDTRTLEQNASGLWQVQDRAVAWMRGESYEWSHLEICHDVLLSVPPCAKLITISDALRQPFDYQELRGYIEEWDK